MIRNRGGEPYSTKYRIAVLSHMNAGTYVWDDGAGADRPAPAGPDAVYLVVLALPVDPVACAGADLAVAAWAACGRAMASITSKRTAS